MKTFRCSTDTPVDPNQYVKPEDFKVNCIYYLDTTNSYYVAVSSLKLIRWYPPTGEITIVRTDQMAHPRSHYMLIQGSKVIFDIVPKEVK